MNHRPELRERARRYAAAKGLALGDQLGFGLHGIVFLATSQTNPGRFAVKVHERRPDYLRERDAYRRLQHHSLSEVRGCAIPEMVGCDDELCVIEMTVVSRPHVLDFGGAFLDKPPGFSEEVLADWHAEKTEQFGPGWAEVLAILRALEAYGIYVVDVNPNNITLA
jgi:hypothetical protein